MKGGKGLRNRLILVFLASTILPLGLTLWTVVELLNRSTDPAPIQHIDQLSQALEKVGREFYQRSRESLRGDAQSGKTAPLTFVIGEHAHWPATVQDFWESGALERFETEGPAGDRLSYLVRQTDGVTKYTKDLAVGMRKLSDQFAESRAFVGDARSRDLRRGYILAFIAICSVVWIIAAIALAYVAHRISHPIGTLHHALVGVGRGDLSARIQVERDDEIGAAMAAFNDMADQLQESREKLIHVTRLASWQALARKTAHEVKNSLTPIRLTMEEIIARRNENDSEFLRQAAQIVVDEVTSLEKRVRAFSEFASEPPVSPEPLDVNGVIEERVSLVRTTFPEVAYDLQLSADQPVAMADPDLVKGILTNLLQNAADAAKAGGVVRIESRAEKGRAVVEVHDSGPGLSDLAKSTIFEPTISFKKGGMGLGLSITRKSALLCGGDVSLIDGELGGAGFRVVLPSRNGEHRA